MANPRPSQLEEEARKRRERREEEKAERDKATGEGRRADVLVEEKSVGGKLKSAREEREKRLKEIMKEMGR